MISQISAQPEANEGQQERPKRQIAYVGNLWSAEYAGRCQHRELAEKLGPDELQITSPLGDVDLRRRSYELVAEVFELAGQPAS